ncbi:MAG: helix-turn-helix domain-containing protein [Myxococcota bacterium]
MFERVVTSPRTLPPRGLHSSAGASPFGRALRRWRTSRRLSQLELATRTGTPARHVSFLETGRSRPSREMVLRLADALDVPLPDRNALLQVAGFAPAFATRPLDDAALGPVRFVIERLLAAHAPYPAIVLDRWYDILDANLGGRRVFLGGAAIDRDDPPSLIDLILGPFKAAVINWDELVWDAVLRLRREVAAAGDDARLGDILERAEAVAKTLPPRQDVAGAAGDAPVLMTRVRFDAASRQMASGGGGPPRAEPARPATEAPALTELRTLSTLVHFGGARDITVDGLHLELVYPADPATDAVLRQLGAP